jgi:hypothetical protein
MTESLLQRDSIPSMPTSEVEAPVSGNTERLSGPRSVLHRSLVESTLDVTILMPCLNEERTLPQCIEWARHALEILKDKHGMTGEILISDNGSQDGSVELAESMGARVVHCKARGYGAALRFGSLSARGRYIVMGDADASYDFRDAIAMIEKLEQGAELCMGSRFTGKIMPGAMPWKNRYIGNPILTGILNLFFRSGFSDAHCGLRAFTKEAFVRINPTSPGMEYASEMVIKAALLGCKGAEVPIVLRPDGRDRAPHLKPFRDGWRHLRYLIMLSPVWLYLVPGLALICFGLAIFALLLTTPPATVATLGPLWFGDHWMPLAMGMTVTGHLSALFAMTATLAGIQNGYRRLTPALIILYRFSRLESLLLISLALIVIGLVVIGDVAIAWAGQHFGPLSMERQMIAGTTALIMGVQSFFGAFLLSVVAGNESDLEKAINEAVQRS